MKKSLGKAVGEGIKRFREKRGLTQRQLAKLAGKSIETISNFERGKTLPGLRTLEGLVHHLGVSLKDLFDGAPSRAVPGGKPSRHAKTVLNSVDLLSEDDLEVVAKLIKSLEAKRKRKK